VGALRTVSSFEGALWEGHRPEGGAGKKVPRCRGLGGVTGTNLTGMLVVVGGLHKRLEKGSSSEITTWGGGCDLDFEV